MSPSFAVHTWIERVKNDEAGLPKLLLYCTVVYWFVLVLNCVSFASPIWMSNFFLWFSHQNIFGLKQKQTSSKKESTATAALAIPHRRFSLARFPFETRRHPLWFRSFKNNITLKFRPLGEAYKRQMNFQKSPVVADCCWLIVCFGFGVRFLCFRWLNFATYFLHNGLSESAAVFYKT